MIKGYITLKEASEISGINIEAYKKRCQEGKIRGALKKGNGWFIPHSEVVVNDDVIADGSLSLLITFVEAAPAGGVSFGITVFLKGAVISGRLVSRETYLNKFKEDVITGTNFKVAGDDIQSKFDETVGVYFDNLLETKEEGTPTFIHMMNSSVAMGKNDLISLNPASLRIRLASVDGFILGSFENNEA